MCYAHSAITVISGRLKKKMKEKRYCCYYYYYYYYCCCYCYYYIIIIIWHIEFINTNRPKLLLSPVFR